VSGRARRGSGVTDAQHAGAIGAFLRRQATQQKREAELEAEVEAIYRKALEAHENTTPQAIRAAILARDAAAAEAERGRERDAARRVVDGVSAEADPVPAPVPIGDGYLSFAEIEAQRHELARAGKPHGYKTLTRQFHKGARSTIVRRYRGLPPPGSPIPGVCEKAPPHQHYGG
jgi:hypothetical protein